MNLLFKLKKDGKTAGYEQVSTGELPDTEEPCLNWVYSKDNKHWDFEAILHDEKCPFVTQDKNGKDVWFDDDVLLKKVSKRKAIAGFKDWVWLYWKDPSTYHWEIAYIGDIELIEE